MRCGSTASVIFGALEKPALAGITDLDSARDPRSSAPLVVLTILFGVYPKPVLDVSAASVDGSSSTTISQAARPQRKPRARSASHDCATEPIDCR